MRRQVRRTTLWRHSVIQCHVYILKVLLLKLDIELLAIAYVGRAGCRVGPLLQVALRRDHHALLILLVQVNIVFIYVKHRFVSLGAFWSSLHL